MGQEIAASQGLSSNPVPDEATDTSLEVLHSMEVSCRTTHLRFLGVLSLAILRESLRQVLTCQLQSGAGGCSNGTMRATTKGHRIEHIMGMRQSIVLRAEEKAGSCMLTGRAAQDNGPIERDVSQRRHARKVSWTCCCHMK